MRPRVSSRSYSHPAVVVAGEVDSEHTSLSLMERQGNSWKTLGTVLHTSNQVIDFPQWVARACLEFQKTRKLEEILGCVIAAHGPVEANSCYLHNLSWQVEGGQLESASGLRTLVVNDFVARSYALPLIDIADPTQIATLHGGGGPQGKVRSVVGAGTGLGVGMLFEIDSGFVALASEAGHMDFAPFDHLTEQFRQFLEKRAGYTPSFELCCSGSGLLSLFQFAKAHGWLDHSQLVVAAVEESPLHDLPNLLAKQASNDPACRRILDTYIRIYARFVCNIAVTHLPRAGLYLAEGTGTKVLSAYTANDLFQRTFLQHNSPQIRSLLEQIPIYMILAEGTTLLGAAHAGFNLL